MARTWMCVRCGSAPRWNDTFLCQKCFDDPQQKREVAEAAMQAGVTTDGTPRRYLIETFHWAGRWSTRG